MHANTANFGYRIRHCKRHQYPAGARGLRSRMQVAGLVFAWAVVQRQQCH